MLFGELISMRQLNVQQVEMVNFMYARKSACVDPTYRKGVEITFRQRVPTSIGAYKLSSSPDKSANRRILRSRLAKKRVWFLREVI